MVHEDAVDTARKDGEAADEPQALAVALPAHWPLPQGVGPRALSQWPITERLTAEEWKQLMNALPGRVGARARHGGNARRFVGTLGQRRRQRVPGELQVPHGAGDDRDCERRQRR